VRTAVPGTARTPGRRKPAQCTTSQNQRLSPTRARARGIEKPENRSRVQHDVVDDLVVQVEHVTRVRMRCTF
jgi:hypothetical protein